MGKATPPQPGRGRRPVHGLRAQARRQQADVNVEARKAAVKIARFVRLYGAGFSCADGGCVLMHLIRIAGFHHAILKLRYRSRLLAIEAIARRVQFGEVPFSPTVKHRQSLA